MSTLFDLFDQIRQDSPGHLDVFASLSDEEFQWAFDALLNEKLTSMEENKKNFASLDEVGLSAVLCLGMAMPGLSATQEQYSNGHVDLTFQSYRFGIARKIRGEAKIYNGPKYHLDGLKQLLGYMTGRELRGLMVVYIRKSNASSLMKKISDRMDSELLENQQGPTVRHPIIKWAFNSKHLHSSGDCLLVSHVGCNLNIES